MDRNKPSGSSRGSKNKIAHHGSEIFALGSKPSSNRDDSKNKVLPSSKNVPERKRESSTSGLSAIVSKKPKLTSSPGPSGNKSSEVTVGVLEYWEKIAIEIEPVDFVQRVLHSIEQQDSDTVVRVVCGAIKALISPKKPDNLLSLSLLYLAKLRPHIFCNETISSGLESILRRDVQNTFKGKNNPTIHILACNLLARGYHNKKQWPENFLKMYIEDAVNERVWVDYDECSSFIDNITSSFGTKIPPKWLLQPELNLHNPNARDSFGNEEESMDSMRSFDSGKQLGEQSDQLSLPRYAHMMDKVEKMVLDAVKEQLGRRQPPDCSTRNFIRFLSTTSGICEVRSLGATRLELWIHNGKLMKPAQELLTYVSYNVTGQTVKDHEVLSNLVKMRLKTKPLINIYMACFKEIINSQPELLLFILKYVVQNELSNARNPNNLPMLANMFQAKPDESATHLAELYQEFLLQRECVLRTLRVFLRELVKMLRYDMNLTVFCKSLMVNRKEITDQLENFEYKERVFSSIVDLISLSMFLSVSPQIREANVSLRTGRDIQKCTQILYNFYAQMSQIQCASLSWILNVAPATYKPTPNEYTLMLHKLLFLDIPESYSKGDQWPPEPERALLLRLVSEVPLHQDSLLCIILIGITKEIAFAVPDTMEVIDQVVRRAGSLKSPDYPPLEVNNLQIIDFLFNMAEYHHPGNIQLPPDYDPPKLAISSLYWKTWIILLMLSAHNTSTIGSFCWEQYPMLRKFMEMCITNQFVLAKPADDELQMATIERSQILEFELLLATVPINEQNSLLLSQLMLMDPLGAARRPPNHILELLKNLNASHRLGHLLCRSRKPDLLLDIIQRQGTHQSMPWLADLVQNNDGDFNHLPVQCLCEFLLSNNTPSQSGDNVRDILLYLQRLLKEDVGDHQITCEVLEYFLRRLSSTSKISRHAAIKGLKMLLQIFETPDEQHQSSEIDWLLRYLPQMAHFMYVRPIIILQLRAASQIETCPELIMIYIQFIAQHTLNDNVTDMLEHVIDMSQLIVERSSIFVHLIPEEIDETSEINIINDMKFQTLNCLFVMFSNFLVKLRESKMHTFPEYPDLLLVHFSDGTQCHILLNIIHAFIILLSHSSMIPNALQFLDYWFPENAPPPQAFNLETNEAVHILPDWLKLKMIRCSVERLVDAALLGLTPDQIVLFVQNFGTPINSMSKLLALLDRAVIEQYEAVNNSIMNKAYLLQLIEIQQMRGAKNGHITMQAFDVKQESPVDENTINQQPGMEEVRIDMSGKEQENQRKYLRMNKQQDIEEAVDIVLQTRNTIQDKTNLLRYRKLVKNLIKPAPSTNQSALKGVAKVQEYTMSVVLNYLQKVARDPARQILIQNLEQNSTTCTFFRTLLNNLSEKGDQYTFSVKIMDEFLNFINPGRNAMLVQLITNYKAKYLRVTIKNYQNQFEKQDLVHLMNTAKVSDVERTGKNLLNDMLKHTNTNYLVESIADILKDTDTGPIKKEVSILNYDQKGLLIDWLANADSEIIYSNPNLQMNLLFGTSKLQFRPYLLSLLSHQASWKTLHSTVDKLLESYNPGFDATIVLDFIDALVRNPKLWQGRDKSMPKHVRVEYIIVLSESQQIHTMIDYILNESKSFTNNEKQIYHMSKRMKLLLQCFDTNNIYILKSLIAYVEEHKLENAEVKLIFLRLLYLNMPQMKFICEDLKDVYNVDLRNLTDCVADKFAQYTVTAVASLTVPRDYQQMGQDMEIIIRKLAATHPSLILRQLSVMASLLQGRSHMDLYVLRAEHHISLFHLVMGVLELLQPQVFEEANKEGFHSALECFFTLLRYHGNTKEVYAILCRLMNFLQAYTNKNPEQALKFIERYTDLMQDLAYRNRNITTLQQLVQGLSLLKHKTVENLERITEDDNDENKTIDDSNIKKSETDSKGIYLLLTPYVKQDSIPQQWPSLVNFIKSGSYDDISGPLQEIENITHKRPLLLNDIFDTLLELIFNPSTNARTVAHLLLVRHLKQNPGNSIVNSNSLTAYIQCLCHDDTSVALSALETLTEMVLCLQEYAPQILNTVFNLGISSKLNTYPQIRKTIAALKTQHAC